MEPIANNYQFDMQSIRSDQPKDISTLVGMFRRLQSIEFEHYTRSTDVSLSTFLPPMLQIEELQIGTILTGLPKSILDQEVHSCPTIEALGVDSSFNLFGC